MKVWTGQQTPEHKDGLADTDGGLPGMKPIPYGSASWLRTSPDATWEPLNPAVAEVGAI